MLNMLDKPSNVLDVLKMWYIHLILCGFISFQK